MKSQFEDQGYVILPGLIEPAVLDGVRVALSTLVEQHAQKLLQAGKISDTFADEPFETRLFRLYQNCIDVAPKRFQEELHLEGIFNLFFHPSLLDVIETLLGPEIRLYPNYKARPKFPDWEGTLVNWHQDGGYTQGAVETLRMVNVWSPLVPATVHNGCMQFVPGTHKLGVVPHEKREFYLEIAPDHLDSRRAQAVDIELNPGDVVLFHNLLFHQGLPNHSDKIRWSLDWRYQDATQDTQRQANGHIARSRGNPSSAVSSPQQWASLSFV